MRLSKLAAILVSGFLAVTAAPLPKGVTFVTSVEGITEYRLENGLKVLLFPDPSKNNITVNITYLVGSRNENYGETGMAHLLEHMVFKGTPNHKDVPKELSSHGTRPNGTTSVDRTNYFETFSATDENLAWALGLEADRMVNSFIAKKDLDSEMTVVRNEFEMGENNPRAVLFQRTMHAAYTWHNYGKTTIGSKADLENVPIDRLQAFYRNYYQPDNAVLTVAGKIDDAKTLDLIVKSFGVIPRPTRKLQETYTREPEQDGERTVTVRRVGDIQALCVMYHVPDGAHPDFPAIDVLADLMTRPPAGRLYKTLVETKKASSVNSGSLQQKEPGLMVFTAAVRKESSIDEARDILLQGIESFVAKPPTPDEVERSKTELLKQFELAMNDSGSIGMFLSEPISAGDWRLFFLDRDRLRKVTADDVVRVAKTYLKPSNRTLGMFIPTEKPDRVTIPTDSSVSAMLTDFKGSAVVAAGEAFDPSTDNIDRKTIRGTLGNGMKLVFVPKKTRGQNVSAAIVLHFGNLDNLKGQSTAASFAGSMLMRGTAKHTRQEITDELSRLKAHVQVIGGINTARASIETTRENLPAVMKLVAEILREPSFPEVEYEQIKQQQLAGAENNRREPQAIAMIDLQKHMMPYPKDDPRYVMSPDENIEVLKTTKLADAKKFYENFYGGTNGELVIVGDFDPEQMQTLTSSLFGNWKSPAAYARVPRPYNKVEASNKSVQIPDKANAMLGAGMPIKIGDTNPDYPALVLGNYILGSGMSSRLFKRVRGTDGLSYSVGSMMSARAKDESGTFMAYAIFAPQNVNKVETALREEIARALKDGFTPAEIEEAKKGLLQSYNVSRAEDRELTGTLASNTFEGRTLAFQGELEKRIAALTADEVVAAMRRHMNPADLSVFKAGDFQKAGVTP